MCVVLNRASGEKPEFRLLDGVSVGISLCSNAGKLAKAMLDPPVFEGVKGNECRAAIGPEQSGKAPEKPVQLPKLIVDCDSQRLKGPGRRVNARGRPWSRLLDDAGEDSRALNGPVGDDGANDATGIALLSVLAENPDQLLFVQVIDEIGGCPLRGRAHPHVQRTVVSKRKAALGPVDLRRGDTEIGQETIDPFKAFIGKDTVNL